jgi:hypothetical protein
MVSVHERKASISKLPVVVAVVLSVPVSIWGLFALAWGGTGNSIPAVILWLLPILAFPLLMLRLLWGRMPVALFWSIALCQFVAGAWINWQRCMAGQCTTTNPFATAATGVFFPPVWGWVLIAAALQVKLKRIIAE